jgi:hypothetical protein
VKILLAFTIDNDVLAITDVMISQAYTLCPKSASHMDRPMSLSPSRKSNSAKRNSSAPNTRIV